jgi:hypothetical protein
MRALIAQFRQVSEVALWLGAEFGCLNCHEKIMPVRTAPCFIDMAMMEQP